MYGTFIKEYNDVSRRYDYESGKITDYMESAFKTFNINKTKAELKVYRESGTAEDLAYLTEAASNGLIDAIKNALRAIKEKFEKFIESIKTKVSERITSAKARQSIKDAEKKVKENPMIGKINVSYTPLAPIETLINKYKDKTDKNVAKLKGLKTLGGQDISDIGTLMKDIESFKNDFGSLKEKLTAKNAVVTITISALIALLISDIKNLDKKIADEKKETDKIVEALSSSVDAEADASVKAAYAQAMNFRTDLSKKQVDGFIADIMNKKNALQRGVNDAILSLKGNVQDREVREVKEHSALDDILFEDDEVMTEGANLQIRRMMIDSNKKIRENFARIKKLLKNHEYAEASKLVKYNKKIINDTYKEVKKVESTVGSVIFAWCFTGMYPLWRKTFLGFLGFATDKKGKIRNDSKALGLLFGGTSYLSAIYKLIVTIDGAIDEYKDQKEVNGEVINIYKTNSLKVLKGFSDVCDKIDAAIKDSEKEYNKLSKEIKKESVDFDDPYGFDDIDDLY